MDNQKRRGVTSIQDVLQTFLRSNGLSSRSVTNEILQAWGDAVGTQLANRARAVRFRSGELTVEVDSSAHYQELKNFTGDQYRRKANKLLGSERVQRVIFKLRG